MFSFHKHQLCITEALPFLTIEFSEMGFKHLFQQLKSELWLLFFLFLLPALLPHHLNPLQCDGSSGWGKETIERKCAETKNSIFLQEVFVLAQLLPASGIQTLPWVFLVPQHYLRLTSKPTEGNAHSWSVCCVPALWC